MASEDSLLTKVAKHLSDPPPKGDAAVDAKSMLLQLATAYSSGGAISMDSEVTQPTGFNPHAAVLFEAVLESAYLVANADGDFDDRERRAFVNVVHEACQGAVSDAQIEALLSDLSDLLQEDGTDKRIEMVAKSITRPEHAGEVIRIAGLLAHVSAGVSTVEREVLTKMCQRFGLPDETLDEVLSEVESLLKPS